MEKNTVLLDLGEYNELRDFVNNIKDGKIYTALGYGDQEYKFYTIDEALDIAKRKFDNAAELERSARRDATDLRENLRNSFKRYESETAAIRGECNEKIGRIMKMSIWEFRRWRRSRQ